MASLWRQQASNRLRSSDLVDDRSGDNAATLGNLFFEAPAEGGGATGNASQTIAVASSATGYARAIGASSRTLNTSSSTAGYARAVGTAARTIAVPSQAAQGSARALGNASHVIGVSSHGYGTSYAPHNGGKKGYISAGIRVGF